MGKKQQRMSRLTALVTALMLLNLITFAMTANAIAQVCDNTPQVSMELPENLEEPQVETPPGYYVKEGTPGIEIRDEDTVWNGVTHVNIFHAWYDNETGEITVASSNGDKLIAPGTGNKYYFDIRNTGTTPVKYWLCAESASTTVEYNGQTVEMPVEIRFSKQREGYLVGGENSWQPLTALDGLKERGGVSPSHYVRYVLDWQWPYEKDDVLDTMLGNMAAEDAELIVRVTFNIWAEADSDASGGIPQTGDTSNLAFWAAVYVLSAFGLVILLFTYYKRKEEESSTP